MDDEVIDVHRLEFDVDWPPWHVAAYLILADEAVLVDAGAPGTRGRKELTNALTELGVDISEVDHLVLTHPHSDHIGQAKTVIEKANPTVYAPKGVQERLERSESDLENRVKENALNAGIPGERVEEEARKAVESLSRNSRLLPPHEINAAYGDGDQINPGGAEFKTIHTPGHQKEHHCLVTRDIMFSGDMVIESFRSAALNVGLDDGVLNSINDFYKAYEKLQHQNVEWVYPGHGPVFTDYDAAVDRSIKSLDELVIEVEELLDEEWTAYELTKKRVEEARRFTFSLLETLGALGYLEKEGRAKSTGTNPMVWSPA